MGSHMFRVRLPFLGELRQYSLGQVQGRPGGRGDGDAGLDPPGDRLLPDPEPAAHARDRLGHHRRIRRLALLLVAPPRLRAHELDQPYRGRDDRREFGDRARTAPACRLPRVPDRGDPAPRGPPQLRGDHEVHFAVGRRRLQHGNWHPPHCAASCTTCSATMSTRARTSRPTSSRPSSTWERRAFIPWAIGIGALTFAIFWLVRRFRPGWPEALIGLALLGIAREGVHHLSSRSSPSRWSATRGPSPPSIPAFAGYPFGPRRLHLLPELAGTAIAISILGMLEAASITKGLAAKSGQKIEPNQELIGMGAANIACSFFGAVPGLVLLRALRGQFPERREDADVLDDEQPGRPRRPGVRHAGLQLHPRRGAGRTPDPHRVQDDQPAPDPDRLPLDAIGPGRVRRHAGLVPLPQARHGHLRRHRGLARPLPAGRPARPPSSSTPSTRAATWPSCTTRASAPTRRSRSSTSRASSSSAPPTSSRSRSAAWPRTRTSGSSSCG